MVGIMYVQSQPSRHNFKISELIQNQKVRELELQESFLISLTQRLVQEQLEDSQDPFQAPPSD